jgi:hypothetical protein
LALSVIWAPAALRLMVDGETEAVARVRQDGVAVILFLVSADYAFARPIVSCVASFQLSNGSFRDDAHNHSPCGAVCSSSVIRI